MTQFESDVTTIPYPVGRVYTILSDLTNLERLKDNVPEDKIKDLQFDSDSCSFSVDPIGSLAFRIIEREPDKTIKFTADKSTIDCFLWIQILPVDEAQSKIKLTIQAELNPFIKGMVSKPIQEGLNKMATMLATISYE